MKPSIALITLIALIALALPGAAQTGRASPANLSVLRSVTIRLDDLRDPIPAAQSGPFCHFVVIDQRPDTARIGVHGNLPIRTHEFDRQLVFPKATDQEIASYLNSHLTRPGANDTALIILRDLWLSDTDPYIPDPERYQTADAYGNHQNHTHIRLKAEIYALRDHRYLPLLRIDTLQQTSRVIYSMLRNTWLGWERDLATILRESTARAAAALPQRETNARWITWEDIRRFNQNRFDIPILDSIHLIRGVYASFEEFRNNTPSVRDFDLMPQNGNLALYLKNGDGTSAYTHQAWGLCNGNQIYLMRDGLLHPVRKEGNSFYFYGIDVSASNSGSPPLIPFADYIEQHCLYIIDLDTGQFY
jgi:hypothetical protein